MNQKHHNKEKVLNAYHEESKRISFLMERDGPKRMLEFVKNTYKQYRRAVYGINADGTKIFPALSNYKYHYIGSLINFRHILQLDKKGKQHNANL